jgi:hypothetical protein
MVKCHCRDCRDCQRETGGGQAATVMFTAEDLEMKSGSPKVFAIQGETGHEALRRFCPDCGSYLFAGSTGRPDFVGVQAGSLDDPSVFKINAHVWTVSAQHWDLLDPDISQFERTRPRK